MKEQGEGVGESEEGKGLSKLRIKKIGQTSGIVAMSQAWQNNVNWVSC